MEPLIFDRTQADSDYASLNQHILNLKGAYSSNDLNRVGEWVNYLADMIQSNGYTIVPPNLKTTWTIYDKPNDNDFNTYLNGVRTIRRSFTIMSTTPGVPYSISELDVFGGWAKANNIEKVLYDIESLLLSMMNIFIRSDAPMAYSGTGFYFISIAEKIVSNQRFMTSDNEQLVTADSLILTVNAIGVKYISEFTGTEIDDTIAFILRSMGS